MQRRSKNPITGLRSPRPLLLAGLLGAALAAACSQGTPAAVVQNEGIGHNGALTDGFNKFVFESNKGGGAPDLTILGVFYGRLVDVFDCKSCGQLGETRKPLFRDLLVDPNVQSDGFNYELETNPVTSRFELTILHPYNEDPNSAFMTAFDALEQGVRVVDAKGVGINELPPFTMVPRNAAVALRFDDLVDPATVDSQNVKVGVGYPPEVPFELRVVPDRCHGDFSNGVFRSTRVILDMTVSKEESTLLGLPVNPVGLPTAVNTTKPNVGIRIPTVVNASAAQFSRLQNLSGQPVAFFNNGPNDPGSPTLDVVRGMRSGGRNNVTLDPYDGFLPDDDPPEVLAAQAISVFNIAAQGGGVFTFDMTFGQAACAVAPKVGDLVDLALADLRVIQDGPPPVGATVTGVTARRIDDLSPNAPPPSGGAGELKFPWNPALGIPTACFLRFNPEPLGGPATDVSSSATLRIAFSEAMNPASVDPFENFTVTDPSISGQPLNQRVVASVADSQDLTSFTFNPSVPFNHVQGSMESYDVDLRSGFDFTTQKSFGLTDLAGNHLLSLPPQVTFTLEGTDPTLSTGGVSLNFGAIDEDGDGNPEIRGQLVWDLSRGVVQPRGVSRFDAYMDPTALSAPTVQAMAPVVGGVIEPLSIYGSRLMTVWRYHDLGMPFFDDSLFNIDLEGLYWMVDPSQAGVKIDFFPEFQLLISHSKYMPDEHVTTPPMGAPFVTYPTSGLTPTFDDNILDEFVEPQFVLAAKDDGYLINPNDSFEPPNHVGVRMHPLPLNPSGTPVSQYTYWTWRDTGVLPVAGPFGNGVDTLGNPPTVHDGYYGANAVPTIGLPMLLDFRTYPAPTIANGTNFIGLAAVNLGYNQPFYRIHSTGGFDSTNTNTILIDPDTEVTAQGGWFNGQQTPGSDSGFYYGGASFVVRVNRLHTIWFDAGSQSSFAPVIYTPGFGKSPPGTSVSLAFRGATNVTPLGPAQNGNNIDPYGNPFPSAGGGTSFTVAYFPDTDWHATLGELDQARYIQARVTMISNEQTFVVPELSALGIAWFN